MDKSQVIKNQDKKTCKRFPDWKRVSQTYRGYVIKKFFVHFFEISIKYYLQYYYDNIFRKLKKRNFLRGKNLSVGRELFKRKKRSQLEKKIWGGKKFPSEEIFFLNKNDKNSK